MFSLQRQGRSRHRCVARHRPRHRTGARSRAPRVARGRAQHRKTRHARRARSRPQAAGASRPIGRCRCRPGENRFQQSLTKFGKLDILVNNAAITRDTLALRMKLEDWDAVLRTNLTGAHLCIQQALGAMLKQRSGRIINISSVVARNRKCGPGELRRFESRPHRAHPRHRRGSRFAKYYRERRRSRLY